MGRVGIPSTVTFLFLFQKNKKVTFIARHNRKISKIGKSVKNPENRQKTRKPLDTRFSVGRATLDIQNAQILRFLEPLIRGGGYTPKGSKTALFSPKKVLTHIGNAHPSRCLGY